LQFLLAEITFAVPTIFLYVERKVARKRTLKINYPHERVNYSKL